MFIGPASATILSLCLFLDFIYAYMCVGLIRYRPLCQHTLFAYNLLVQVPLEYFCALVIFSVT